MQSINNFARDLVASYMNKTALRHYLHDHDTDVHEKPCCYFSENGTDDGWGFWVNASGEVIVDETSASGELPSQRIVSACVRAAKKYLN
jgi:hypothetical protein